MLGSVGLAVGYQLMSILVCVVRGMKEKLGYLRRVCKGGR